MNAIIINPCKNCGNNPIFSRAKTPMHYGWLRLGCGGKSCQTVATKFFSESDSELDAAHLRLIREWNKKHVKNN